MISQRGSGVLNNAAGSVGSLSLDLTGISGLVKDDVVVVIAVASGSATDPIVSGYTDSGVGLVAQGACHVRMQYKIMGLISDTTAVVSGAGLLTGFSICAVAFAFSGVNISSPVSGLATFANATGTTAPNPPAVTPADNNCCIIIGAGNLISDTTVTPPANYGGLITATQSTTNSSTVAGAFRVLSGGAGVSEDPGLFTGWTLGAWAAITMALKPLVQVPVPGFNHPFP